MSNFALIVDTNRRPLNPIHPAQARLLLKQRKASILRRFPFTIILKTASNAQTQPLEIKIDPGSKVTGLVLVTNSKVIWAAELTHRGAQIKAALLSRRQLRRNRRSRKTRYRKARFLNRTRPNGWLAPSLKHRVQTTLTWVNRLRRFAPVTAIAQELVKFDTQLMQDETISGPEYQSGTLAGYEIRSYLLEKFDRKCAYCGVEHVPFEIDHIIPRSKNGSDRPSNLCLSCHDCNQAKSNHPIQEFLADKPDVLKRLLALAKSPLRDAAAVNSTRWALFDALKATDLPITTGTGGRTRWNRFRFQLPKTHWIDAALVGAVETITLLTNRPLSIACNGHGTRQSCRTDRFGFPSRYVPQYKFVKGFQTGDLVKAVVTKGKKVGTYIGRCAVRSSGSFNISTKSGLIQGISHRYCQTVHSKDGYNYSF
ncbi:RNA-guided endonuclease IscB [Chamaesiphon polymorphus]|uniref:HNH endonuclease n=1 Tax=Chamaesiphon polymorphus CCALA 037 TaxID=2107692 RepID=A0A2T1G2V2_9CYAN|nr:RNA-guided endonuclease IscB [Chamaesiphon polymorphus]PSB51583.1 HNH endonuclease [Chamaesiphon polymorphus CCALA 037]